MSEPPFLVALCASFRHPEQLANSLWLWEQQTYPAHRRHLIIVDDGQTFASQRGENWGLFSLPQRTATLPDKLHLAAELGRQPPNLPQNQQVDAFAIWDDDDIYLPRYLEQHAQNLKAGAQLSKPAFIWTDYSGEIKQEGGGGRFHSSVVCTVGLFDQIGGWPRTARADFDLQFIANLTKAATVIGNPPVGQYVYAWHTGAAHCQWAMKSPGDTEWYARAATIYKPVPYVGLLSPKQDDRTRTILASIATATPAPI